MSDNIQKKDGAESRPALQKWVVVGFIVFVVFGFFLSLPCLCREGAIRGYYKNIFYMIVLVRLSYGLLKRNLQLVDYLLWVGSFVGFCIFVEYL